METLFFLLFASLAVIFALGVVLARNPVYSALSLIACFVQIAALFILLRSPFLAAAQIFVYVGSTIVLFVIVIVMLDIRKAAFERFTPGNRWLTLSATVLLGGIMLFMLLSSELLSQLPASRESTGARLTGTTAELGTTLFSEFLLPFEVVSVILLVALIGAILLAKKEPFAGGEPSESRVPSAGREPSAGKEPSADRGEATGTAPADPKVPLQKEETG